jgi:hypothetical protein
VRRCRTVIQLAGLGQLSWVVSEVLDLESSQEPDVDRHRKVNGWILTRGRSRAIDRVRFERRKKRFDPFAMEPPPLSMWICVGKSEATVDHREIKCQRASVHRMHKIAWRQLRASRRGRDRRVRPLNFALGAPANRRPWT